MAVKDLKLNPPEKKADLTKENMLHFIKTYGTAEEKIWFVNLMNENKTSKFNNITKKDVDGYDIKAVREEFAKKFFYELSKEAKKAKSKKKATFEEELIKLTEGINL